MTHSSIFHYNVTRPYPFRWFTPLVAAGGIILFGLFSTLNLAQNGYELAVEYANNPNRTIGEGIWFKKWPSYLTSSVRPRCQPANLPVGSQIFTNQSGLSYTITSVSNGKDPKSPASPSLPYYNNVLESCDITQFEMSFDGMNNQTWALFSQTAWNIQLRAFITCGIHGPLGYTKFNMTAMYDPLTGQGDIPGSSVFISRHDTTKSTLYWAEALLSAYWVDAVYRIWSVSSDTGMEWQTGIIWLTREQEVQDIDSRKFFNARYNFLSNYDGQSHWSNSTSLHVFAADNYTNADIPIWPEVDKLGKSMYSAVLADLGQTTASSGASILNNEALLQRYTSNFTWIAVHSYIWTAFYTPIELESYHTLRNEGKTGPLEFKPSVISTKYLCQVPQLKSVSDIFISVLLADLVLLSAAWRLYTFLVEQVLLGKGPADNYCEGCLRRDNDDLLLPKLSSPPSRASNATKWFATAPQIPETEYSPLGNVLVENIDRVRTR